jgi:alanyl-tRNA synthetase
MSQFLLFITLLKPLASHVKHTSDIKTFAILEESAIAKGTRRIVAATGEEATKVVFITFDALSFITTFRPLRPTILLAKCKPWWKTCRKLRLPLLVRKSRCLARYDY